METPWLDELLAASGYRLSRETLERRVVSNEHRREIARDIGADWETLAPYIGISDRDVEDIKEEYRRPVDKRFAMMRKWHELYGSEATYLKLINGLIQVGRRDLIQSLIMHAGHVSTNDDVGESVSQGVANEFSTTLILYIGILISVCATGTVIFFSQPSFMWKGFSDISFTNLQSSNQESSYSSTYIQPGKSIQPWASDRTSNDNLFTRCDPPSSDLPMVDDEIFVGRESDMTLVVNMMTRARIININGAPGIGKSALAIHVGYEMIKRNGTSVRYINMDEKASLVTKNMTSNQRV